MKKLGDIEQSIVQLSRYIIIISLAFLVIVGIFVSIISIPKNQIVSTNISKTEAAKSNKNSIEQSSAVSTTNTSDTQSQITDNLWSAPAEGTIPKGPPGEEILYGKDLIANTAKYLGPNGSVAAISNGMNCQNCHNDAGRKP